MPAIDDLMRVVDEVVSASAQCSTAQRNGATWEEFTDDRKHYAARWCALKDMLQNLLSDRTRLEYEAAMLMTAMTDVLSHFTKTPSTLRDSEVRCLGHAANARMMQALHEIGAEHVTTLPRCRDDGRCQYAIDHGAEGLAACLVGKCVEAP